jgi:hypothetical protein
MPSQILSFVTAGRAPMPQDVSNRLRILSFAGRGKIHASVSRKELISEASN